MATRASNRLIGGNVLHPGGPGAELTEEPKFGPVSATQPNKCTPNINRIRGEPSKMVSPSFTQRAVCTSDYEAPTL